MALVSFIVFLFLFVTAKVTPLMLSPHGHGLGVWGTFLVYAIICAAMALWAALFLPGG